MRLIRRCVKAPKAKEIARRAVGAGGFGSKSRCAVKSQIVERIGQACGRPQAAHDPAQCFVSRCDRCFCDKNGVLVAD